MQKQSELPTLSSTYLPAPFILQKKLNEGKKKRSWLLLGVEAFVIDIRRTETPGRIQREHDWPAEPGHVRWGRGRGEAGAEFKRAKGLAWPKWLNYIGKSS